MVASLDWGSPDKLSTAPNVSQSSQTQMGGNGKPAMGYPPS